MYFYLDALKAKKKNDMKRVDMNWVGRNGAVIPINMQVDREDCSQGCVVTQATYANAQWFLEYRPYIETVNLWGVNPGMEWEAGKNLVLDAQANFNKSDFHASPPTVGPVTRASSGVTVNFTNGEIPTIATNINLNDPTLFVWDGGRVNQQEEFRKTEAKGGRLNSQVGRQQLQREGWPRLRRHRASHHGARQYRAWQAAVCGNNRACSCSARTERRLQRGQHSGRHGRRALPGLRHRLHGSQGPRPRSRTAAR
jgi:hypothetical protein